MNTQRSNVGALVGGTLLIGFGVLALFGQLFRDFRLWSYVWPFAVRNQNGAELSRCYSSARGAAVRAAPCELR